MIKIEIKGGLGNQLFQYAHARNLEITKRKDITLDLSFFENNNKNLTVGRSYKLKHFNIAPIKTIRGVKTNYVVNLIDRVFIKLKIKKDRYFQSEQYFKDIENVIREEFTLRSPFSEESQKYLDLIQQNTDSVSIHIRRGDYLNNSHTKSIHGLCDINYYKQTTSFISDKIKHPTYFIFSDDIDWAKENIKLNKCIFVSNPKIEDFEELILMSKCAHNIIANSTFSWWSAWLNSNKNKIVIAPRQWTVRKTSNDLKILPKEWVQL